MFLLLARRCRFVSPQGHHRNRCHQILDDALIGMEPMNGVWASDHFGVLAALGGDPQRRDRVRALVGNEIRRLVKILFRKLLSRAPVTVDGVYL